MPPANERPHWVRPAWSPRCNSPAGPTTGSRARGVPGPARRRGAGVSREDAATDARAKRRQDARRGAASPARRPSPTNLVVGARRRSRRSKTRRRPPRAAGRHRARRQQLKKPLWPSSASPRASSCATTSRSRRSCCPCGRIGRWSCAASPTASTGPRSTSSARPTRCRAGVRVERVPADNEVPDAPHRRLAHDAALHDPARLDLAGPVVLARAVADRHGLRRDRSRSDGGRAVRARARRRALGARRARRAGRRRGRRRPRARAGCTSTCRCRPGTPYEAGMLFCQIVATLVAARSTRARPPSSAR